MTKLKLVSWGSDLSAQELFKSTCETTERKQCFYGTRLQCCFDKENVSIFPLILVIHIRQECLRMIQKKRASKDKKKGYEYDGRAQVRFRIFRMNLHHGVVQNIKCSASFLPSRVSRPTEALRAVWPFGHNHTTILRRA